MSLRVHDFVGANPNPVASYVDVPGGDDEGAPPAMPANARVTKVGGDGEIVAESSSPQGEAEIAIERAKAAAKLARGTKARGAARPDPVSDLNEARTLRARCLEIASRGGTSSATEVIADARALLDFVENG